MKCEGKPTTTQRLDWQEANSPHTYLYNEHLLLELVGSTIEDVSIKENISYDAGLGSMERQIEKRVDWSKYTELGTVGMDEIALKKGHRDFVTVVSARLKDQQIVILGVLKGRAKDKVIEFLRSIPLRLRETILMVCCDMYEGFSEAVREELKGATIVVDRFHVTQHYHAAADDLRQEELKRLKKELPKKEYRQLKGSLWAFRKNPADLRPEERTILRKVFKHAPALKQAYTFRLELTAIFEQRISKAAAEKKIRAWIQRVKASQLTCFNKFIGTLENW